MRHQQRSRTFNRPKSGRKALIRHLSQSLILKGAIETTVPKAREAGRFTEQLIQFGIQGDLTSYRRALGLLGDAEATSFLFKEVAPLFKSRHGGYTRILRNRIRPGDGAELATLELVERKIKPEKEKKEKQPKKEKIKETAPSVKTVEEPKAKKEKEERKEKRGGFLANLRKFIKPTDRS